MINFINIVGYVISQRQKITFIQTLLYRLYKKSSSKNKLCNPHNLSLLIAKNPKMYLRKLSFQDGEICLKMGRNIPTDLCWATAPSTPDSQYCNTTYFAVQTFLYVQSPNKNHSYYRRHCISRQQNISSGKVEMHAVTVYTSKQISFP